MNEQHNRIYKLVSDSLQLEKDILLLGFLVSFFFVFFFYKIQFNQECSALSLVDSMLCAKSG